MAYYPTTKQIRAFLSVARHLQFTRAGRELHMSQPAVTAQINLLEQQLGLRLFDRTKREVALTAAGRDLLPILEGIGTGYETLLARLGKHKTGKSCLYINKLADVDMAVLRELVQRSVDHMNGR